MGCYSIYNTGGDYGMYTRNARIIADNFKLPTPSYVPQTISTGSRSTPYGFSYQDCLLAGYTDAVWNAFCSPPNANCPTSNGTNIIDSETGQTGTHTIMLYRGNALAGMFIPKNPCISYIAMTGVVGLSNDSVYIVEVRKDDNGVPYGSPGDDNYITKSEVSIREARGISCGGGWNGSVGSYNISIPVNAILESYDVPYWVVIYSSDFICSNAYTGDSYIKAKLSHWRTLSQAFPNEEFKNLAIYSVGSSGCGWTLDSTYGNIAHIVYTTEMCEGCVNIIDSGFAVDGIGIDGDECFRPLEDVKNKNVQIRVEYESSQNYKQARFNIAYKIPDEEYFTGSVVIDDIKEGINTIILDTGELYRAGIGLYYEDLNVTGEVTQIY